MTENIQSHITDHIIQKYDPDAIILHGSRARGMAREHSDWDVILLYRGATEVVAGREWYEGQNIEYFVAVLPVVDIIQTFGTKLQEAIVLSEQKGEGTDLLRQAQTLYGKGIQWTSDDIHHHKLWFQGRIDGMRDCVNSPPLFQKYFSDLYPRVFNYWYLVKKQEYSKPIYVALEEISSQDPEYYQLIITLIDENTSLEGRKVVAEKIRDYLFIEAKSCTK